MSAKCLAKPSLSKGILEMKFMKRTKAKVDKEIEAAEGRAMYSSEITDKMLNGDSNFIIEPSFVHCENLIEGRLSFRGMNPEIERLLELEREEKAASKRQEQSTDVSNEAMMKFYQNLPAGAGHTIQRKFKKINNIQNKNNSKNNKRHILDDDAGVASAGKNKKQKFNKPKDSDEDEQNY